MQSTDDILKKYNLAALTKDIEIMTKVLERMKNYLTLVATGLIVTSFAATFALLYALKDVSAQEICYRKFDYRQFDRSRSKRMEHDSRI